MNKIPVGATIAHAYRFAFGHVLGVTQILGAIVILGAAAGMNLGWTIPLPRPKSGRLSKGTAE